MLCPAAAETESLVPQTGSAKHPHHTGTEASMSAEYV